MNNEREPVWTSGKALGLSAEDDGSSFSSNVVVYEHCLVNE